MGLIWNGRIRISASNKSNLWMVIDVVSLIFGLPLSTRWQYKVSGIKHAGAIASASERKPGCWPEVKPSVTGQKCT